MIGLGRQVPFGQTTERFFVEGEQHEAQQWQDVALPPDDEPEPKRRRGSIDKVPRQRGAMFALAVFAICLVVGLGVGASELLKTGNRLDTFLSLFKAAATGEQALPAAPTNPPQMRPQVTPFASEPSQPRPQVATPTPSAVPTAPGPVPVMAIVRPAAPSVTELPAGPQTSPDRSSIHKAERARSESVAERREYHRRHPHDNYVWSQELNALVPAPSMAEPALAVASSRPNSPPKEPSGVERANPFQQNDLTPARLHSSTIAPATTGAPTPERQAPNHDDDVDPFQR
jgi:hypothetical protein